MTQQKLTYIELDHYEKYPELMSNSRMALVFAEIRESRKQIARVDGLVEALEECHDELADHLNHGSKCFHCGCAVKSAAQALKKWRGES